MTPGYFSPFMAGWTAIVTGVAAILALIFTTLMVTVNLAFGMVNDVFNAMIGILSAILAWMLYPEFHSRSLLMSQIGRLFAVIGAICTIAGSIPVIDGYTDFVLAGWYTGVGNALVGVWLAGLCYLMQYGDTLPHNLVVFGLVVGAFMAAGLIGIPRVFAGIDSMESMSGYLYIAFFGFLRTCILYPIWTIWFGQSLLQT